MSTSNEKRLGIAMHHASSRASALLSRRSKGRFGKVAAKARGVAFGRPKKMRPDQQQLARELVCDRKSISAVANCLAGLSADPEARSSLR